MARYLVSLRGELAQPELGEIFSHSLVINSVASPGGLASLVKTGWTTLWNDAPQPIKNYYNDHTAYLEVVVAEILNLSMGTVTAAWHEPFSPVLRGAITANPMLPSQNSIAISLTAGTRPNGTPLKGRFYMPGPASSIIDMDGTLLLTARDALAVALQKFLVDLKAGSHLPSVWSRSIPTTQTVDTVRVGNKVDTIRTRRNKLPELYKVLTV